MDTNEKTPEIRIPAADDLDTAGWSETSGFEMRLYLRPAAETKDGVPRVEIHQGVGNIGTPAPAYHGRWASICSVKGGTVGESVRESLEAITPELLDLDAAYRGAEWDGANMHGHWDLNEDGRIPGFDAVSEAWAQQHLRTYWTAEDWFEGSTTWEELATEAGVDPRRALDDSALLDKVVERVAEHHEPEDEDVSGIEEFVRARLNEYRKARQAS